MIKILSTRSHAVTHNMMCLYAHAMFDELGDSGSKSGIPKQVTRQKGNVLKL